MLEGTTRRALFFISRLQKTVKEVRILHAAVISADRPLAPNSSAAEIWPGDDRCQDIKKFCRVKKYFLTKYRICDKVVIEIYIDIFNENFPLRFYRTQLYRTHQTQTSCSKLANLPIILRYGASITQFPA
jgi:hypothetical protein